MSEYKKVINQVVAKSGLSGLEKERLEEELQAHFEDANKDYLTKGKSEEEVIEDFGDPNLVGQQIRIVKKKWENIPILGDLIYYPIFRAAISLGIIELILVFISPASILGIGFALEEFRYSGDNDVWSILIMAILFAIIPLLIIIFKGIRATKLIRKINDLLFLMILSTVPISCLLMIIYIPKLFISSTENFIWSNLVMQLVGLVLFQVIYFVSYLISRLIKKYVR